MKWSSQRLIVVGSVVLALAVAGGVWAYLGRAAQPRAVESTPTPAPTRAAASSPDSTPTSTPAPTRGSGALVVAAVGDSNTYGAGVEFDDIGRNAYPAQLQRLLGGGARVLNYGLSGRTLLSTGDSPYRDDEFWAISHEVGADVVLIMLGTNDTKPQNWDAPAFERELADFAASYLSLPSPPDVYLLTPPAAYENVFGVDPALVSDDVAPIVRRVAAQLGIPVIDVHAATENRPERFPDGIHPDAAGYGLIAEAVEAALAR